VFGFYIDTSIHQIGYIAGLIDYLKGILYTDSSSSMEIIREEFPHIKIKYFGTLEKIIATMITDEVKVIILQDFHYQKFEKLKKKGVKFVQIFHGTSDKSYNLNREVVNYDLVCLTGKKMMDDFEQKGLNKNKNCIITGNLKADLIFNNIYNRDQEIKKLGLDPSIKNVLYAPTWMDGMGNSSFKRFGIHLPEYFPEEFQLTIKLHPNLYFYKNRLVQKLKNKIKGEKNILLLEGNKKIYNIIPILAAADLLLTDVSGVSHEYIAFLKPMIFLNNRNIIRFFYGKKRTRIWEGGDVVKKLKDLPSVIRYNLANPDRYKNKQESLLDEIYTFKDGKTIERIASAVCALI